MRYKAFWVLAASALVFIFSPQVHAVPVDLSTFEVIDSTVISGPGNSSATIAEDSFMAPVGLLESDLDIPTEALSLTFDYELVIAPYNEDYFDFYFDDLSGPSESFGGYNDSGTENLIYKGTISLDLAPYAGSTLAIAFALNYGIDDGYTYEVLDEWGSPTYIGNEFASTLAISSVQINPVPEPATLFLVGSGVLGIIGFRKRKIAGAT